MIEDSKYNCDVCLGMGTYPIINRHGQDLYAIPCPECHRPALARLALEEDADNHQQNTGIPHRLGKDVEQP